MQFGYVEVKDGQVVCYTGDSNKPDVHKFDNDEIVNAVTNHPILLHNNIKLRKIMHEIIKANEDGQTSRVEYSNVKAARIDIAKIVLQTIGE